MTVEAEALELVSLPIDPEARLQAIIDSPDFDPRFRDPVIKIDRWDPVFGWGCLVPSCDIARYDTRRLCTEHANQYRAAHARDKGLQPEVWAQGASPRKTRIDTSLSGVRCSICPDRPAASSSSGEPLCKSHVATWSLARSKGSSFEQWRRKQKAHPGLGPCRVVCCDSLAAVTTRDRDFVALCNGHSVVFRKTSDFPFSEVSNAEFDDFCLRTPPLRDSRVIDMRGLPRVAELELRFVLWQKSTGKHGVLPPNMATYLVNAVRSQQVARLEDLDLTDVDEHNKYTRKLHAAALRFLELWLTPATEEWEKDVIDIRVLGYDFDEMRTISFEQIQQPWLKELARSWVKWRIKSPKLRSGGPIMNGVLGITEFSLFLASDRGDKGMDPRKLSHTDIELWIEDLNKRVNNGRSLRRERRDRRKERHSAATKNSRYATLMGARTVLSKAQGNKGWAKDIGLPRDVVIDDLPPMPVRRKPRPFDDSVARALGDSKNITLLEQLDRADSGAGDVWATEVCTGRRISEVLELGLDCTTELDGRYKLWHDQTKVNQLEEAVPIPKWIYDRLQERKQKTLARFARIHSREPTTSERREMKLFASSRKDRWLRSAGTHNWFTSLFKQWLELLDVPGVQTHQARHTLATALYKHGATLEQIRRFLGHCSQVMSEHYVEIASDDIEVALQQLWVWGPAHPQAGQVQSALRGAVTAAEAATILKDLVDVGTRVHGGLCLNQIVLFQKQCPFGQDCDNCDDYVVPLAELPWWRRRRDHMYALAEQAPTIEAGDYIRESFRPYLDVIEGLEAIVRALDLTDAMDAVTQRPPNFFNDMWRKGVAASDLIKFASPPDDESAA